MEISVFQDQVQEAATRPEALRNLAQRPREPEMRRLSSVLIQAHRFGSSISKVLRSQARYMRIRRRQRAEEAAANTAFKMIFPIALCIFPALFVVILGPAFIDIIMTLSSL